MLRPPLLIKLLDVRLVSQRTSRPDAHSPTCIQHELPLSPHRQQPCLTYPLAPRLPSPTALRAELVPPHDRLDFIPKLSLRLQRHSAPTPSPLRHDSYHKTSHEPLGQTRWFRPLPIRPPGGSPALHRPLVRPISRASFCHLRVGVVPRFSLGPHL